MLSQATKQYIKTHWYKHELIPIFGIIGGGVAIAAYAAGHALRGPDVVWDRRTNPHPWNDVKENETTKFIDPNGRFERKWSRERL
ncbi:hypothetical protein H4219_004631 [Mycoemilia scoparia]|uniref:NADH dehydrogenase [ubiquinone] 1 alpha subcomplex subunit 4 n=1 Tax=Mycoemilia scoparia TaxID=417184 RepID=A0A9W8DMI9_9FUNG|nr:hypothetical protein H4219_004631 [Mycoemilia scoparia]